MYICHPISSTPYNTYTHWSIHSIFTNCTKCSKTFFFDSVNHENWWKSPNVLNMLVVEEGREESVVVCSVSTDHLQQNQSTTCACGCGLLINLVMDDFSYMAWFWMILSNCYKVHGGGCSPISSWRRVLTYKHGGGCSPISMVEGAHL